MTTALWLQRKDPLVSENRERKRDDDGPLSLARSLAHHLSTPKQTKNRNSILSGAHSFGISATSSPQGLLNTPVFSNKYYRAILSGVSLWEIGRRRAREKERGRARRRKRSELTSWQKNKNKKSFHRSASSLRTKPSSARRRSSASRRPP